LSDPSTPAGRLRKAPENFLDRDGVGAVWREAKAGRRDFIRKAFAAAAAGAAGGAGRSPTRCPPKAATRTS
jgi:sulfane dehydrogenase subunit SoxC